MSVDGGVVGAFVFIVLLLVTAAGCALVVGALRERAYQRRKEAEYAVQWISTHRQHQDRGRYLNDDPNRPE